MKASKITFLLTVLFITNLQAQDKGEQILLGLFGDPRVYPKTANKLSAPKNIIYLRVNEILESHLENYVDVMRQLSEEHGEAARLCSDENTDIRAFTTPNRVIAGSGHGVDVVVIFENFNIRKDGTASLKFRTTNLDLKRYQKLSHPGAIYYRFECLMKMNGSHWAISKIEVRECPFKEIH